MPLRVKLNTGRVLRYTIVYCAARGTLQSPRSSSRSASAHDRLARVAGSQFLTVESSLPLVSFLPSELKHTDLISAECPLRGDPICSPVLASQIRIEKSLLPYSNPPPLAIFSPQGEKHIDSTGSACPLTVERRSPDCASNTLIVPSWHPATMRFSCQSMLKTGESQLRGLKIFSPVCAQMKWMRPSEVPAAMTSPKPGPYCTQPIPASNRAVPQLHAR